MQELIDERIQAYYGREFDEHQRLCRPAGRLELARVRELVEARLGRHATVVDIGGGTGVHAAWLARAGHQVVLVDPVPRHVAAASRLAGVTAVLGDARHLDLADGQWDAALLFGPLYHLAERVDRVTALREAARVVRPGGLVFAAVIPRWAVYSDQMTSLADGAVVPEGLHTIIDTGRNRPGGRFPGGHFHTSAELAAEMGEAGLDVVDLVAIEGPGGLPLELLGEASDEVIEAALALVRAVGREPGAREMTGHLMGIGRTR